MPICYTNFLQGTNNILVMTWFSEPIPHDSSKKIITIILFRRSSGKNVYPIPASTGYFAKKLHGKNDDFRCSLSMGFYLMIHL